MNGCDILKTFLSLSLETFVLSFLNGLPPPFGAPTGGGPTGGGFASTATSLFALLCPGDILGDDVNCGLRFSVAISRFWLALSFSFSGSELF